MSEFTSFAFGDLDSGRFGVAVVAGESRAWALSLARVECALHEAGDRVEIAEVEPSQRWRVSLGANGAGFDLEFAALAEAVAFPDGDEQLCRVTGTITPADVAVPINCLGQRGRVSNREARAGLVRRVGAWLDEDEAILARAGRPMGADPDAETLSAFLLEGEPPVAAPIADPRLSTQYDMNGRHVRAGLELWVSEEDDYARRAAGEALSWSSVVLDGQRVDCAFLHWRTHGREGAGIYDVLRPA